MQLYRKIQDMLKYSAQNDLMKAIEENYKIDTSATDDLIKKKDMEIEECCSFL